jgi:hypothetical protein
MATHDLYRNAKPFSQGGGGGFTEAEKEGQC